MITSFRSKEAEDIFDGNITKQVLKQLPRYLHKKAQEKLDQINATTKLETLNVPPSNHLEKLKGNLIGFYSIKINDQYRVIFRWKDCNAYDVDIVDYH
ncbi:type II toxin-antitoxin system RelE/ParE family toxin [Thiotrichales bacterium 19X7-9]|nr:type II toxin-antitoxin system RelE/ParE family toxin [Thiotrichales bacterium 19X7-9]